ncbi:hypothetical protein [Micromonospora aurantiaca (nom. illeg.)]|uniref:hypothetical protein n=1 Tax=Micromonospora aurantiaca (nom. illeg.) TaxID=47850 RepID=UPI003F4A4D50
MTPYIVVSVGGALIGAADALWLVGHVVQSGGSDVVVAVARCSTQSEAQQVADGLNGAS